MYFQVDLSDTLSLTVVRDSLTKKIRVEFRRNKTTQYCLRVFLNQEQFQRLSKAWAALMQKNYNSELGHFPLSDKEYGQRVVIDSLMDKIYVGIHSYGKEGRMKGRGFNFMPEELVGKIKGGKNICIGGNLSSHVINPRGFSDEVL